MNRLSAAPSNLAEEVSFPMTTTAADNDRDVRERVGAMSAAELAFWQGAYVALLGRGETFVNAEEGALCAVLQRRELAQESEGESEVALAIDRLSRVIDGFDARLGELHGVLEALEGHLVDEEETTRGVTSKGLGTLLGEIRELLRLMVPE